MYGSLSSGAKKSAAYKNSAQAQISAGFENAARIEDQARKAREKTEQRVAIIRRNAEVARANQRARIGRSGIVAGVGSAQAGIDSITKRSEDDVMEQLMTQVDFELNREDAANYTRQAAVNKSASLLLQADAAEKAAAFQALRTGVRGVGVATREAVSFNDLQTQKYGKGSSLLGRD